jgi:ferredoxin
MQLKIDQARCTGNTVCAAVAPDLIEMRDDGKAYVIREEHLTPEFRNQMLEAVSMCPAQAISVSYD